MSCGIPYSYGDDLFDRRTRYNKHIFFRVLMWRTTCTPSNLPTQVWEMTAAAEVAAREEKRQRQRMVPRQGPFRWGAASRAKEQGGRMSGGSAGGHQQGVLRSVDAVVSTGSIICWCLSVSAGTNVGGYVLRSRTWERVQDRCGTKQKKCPAGRCV